MSSDPSRATDPTCRALHAAVAKADDFGRHDALAGSDGAEDTAAARLTQSPEAEFVVRWDGAAENGSPEGIEVQVLPSKRNNARTVWDVSSLSVRQVFAQLVLPIGYPQSVAEGYWEYQVYDSLQGLCSYLRGVVSTSAVLHATGVGNANAHALSAAMSWAARDGLGMVGGLLFSYLCSPLFDMYVKEFRFFADCINNVGLTLDMLAPYFVIPESSSSSSSVIFSILAMSTICKTMCGMSAGATKGRITQHFAVNGNMADLTAKESTQETLVSLVGMIGGMTLASFLHVDRDATSGMDENELRTLRRRMEFWTWLVFAALTALHVWSNYRGVELLQLNTLNRERTKQALLPLLIYLTSTYDDDSGGSNLPVSSLILGPDQISESMTSSTVDMFVPTIRMNDSFHPVHFVAALSLFLNRNNVPSPMKHKYLIGYHPGKDSVQISLLKGAEQEDHIAAYLHAMLLLQHQEYFNQMKKDKALSTDTLTSSFHQMQRISSSSDTSVGQSLSRILREKGWDVDGRLYLGFSSATSVVTLSTVADATNDSHKKIQ